MNLAAPVACVGLGPPMIADGIAREALQAPKTGRLTAHEISTGVGIALVFGDVWLVFIAATMVIPWLVFRARAGP